MSEKRYLVILGLAIMLLISVPYYLGFQASNSQSQFGGFLINPVDGHSYLAKMQQGFNGEWKFKLPYSAEPGEGAFLFLFYLGLGHLGRLANIPLVYLFHAARILSAAWLVLTVYRLVQTLFKENKAITAGFILILAGSGLGWMAALMGGFTSDFWVAEAYPFLSMYTNPHFTLGIGIMITAILPEQRDKVIVNLLSGLLLGIIQPFAVVILILVKIIDGGLQIRREGLDFKGGLRAGWIWSSVGFGMAGGVGLLYQLWSILRDPILAQWHQQNITLKPTALDLILSLSPSLILGAIGVARAWRSDTGKRLTIWAVICLLLVFVPWGLQRRFLTGIFLPLAALSVYGIQELSERTPVMFRHWSIAVLFLAIPTNLIVITSGLQAIKDRDPKVFIGGDLLASLEWIDINAGQSDLVLADGPAGLYIPSLTGRRVVYGHPFETIKAEEELEFLEEVFHQPQTETYYEKVLGTRGIDYVLCDEGVEQTFQDWLLEHWQIVYSSDGISIFATQ